MKHFNGPLLAVCCFLAAPLTALSQVGPQGQEGRWVAWNALQIDQQLGRSAWTWSSILAYSRRSDFNPEVSLQHFGVFCFRQEFARKLNKRLRLSLGTFYSNIGTDGFDTPHPAFLNEIRFYPRVYWDFPFAKWRLSLQLRQDFRYFSNPGFRLAEKPFEARSRFSIRAYIPLPEAGKTTLILNDEFLGAADLTQTNPQGNTLAWQPFRLTEDRAWVFLRLRLGSDCLLDIGEMTQFRLPLRGNPEAVSFYGALGLTVKNPFSKKQARN